jgi:hypothetical protein
LNVPPQFTIKKEIYIIKNKRFMKTLTIYRAIPAALLAIAITLGGCRKDEYADEQTTPCDLSEAVQFEALTDAAITRGTPVSSATGMASMGVFCATTGTADWSAGAAYGKMNNQRLDNRSGVWEYSAGQDAYWDAVTMADRYTFFAYAPYGEGAGGNGIGVLAGSTGKPSLQYKVPANVTRQPDLMVAVPRYNTRPTGSAVALQMKHALTCVGFQISGRGEQVTGISISGVSTQGNLEIDGSTIKWSGLGKPVNTDFSASLNFAPGKDYVLAGANMSTSLIAADGYLMMIPQTLGSNAVVKVTLKGGEVWTLPLNGQVWEAGKRVTYRIGLTLSAKSVYGWGYYNNDAGYLMQVLNGKPQGTRRIVDADINFGTAVNSTVRIEKYSPTQTFRYSMLSGWDAENNLSKIKAMFDSKPDIVLTGFALNVGNPKQVASYIMEYLKAGGVLILLLEESPLAEALFKAMYPGRTIFSQRIWPWTLPINDAGDEITNGPFGNIGGKLLGVDAHSTNRITGLPETDLVVYSRDASGAPVMFRHKTYNLFFIGDGGPFANLNGTEGDRAGTGYTDIYPLAFDNNSVPVTRTNWNIQNVGLGSVENARLFANIMAWAAWQAQFHGINTTKP